MCADCPSLSHAWQAVTVVYRQACDPDHNCEQLPWVKYASHIPDYHLLLA